MSSSNEVIFDLEESPSEIVRKTLLSVKRGERALIKRGDPKIARRAFRNARKQNIKVMSAVQIEYNLNKEEIKQFVGRDINDTNDELMTLTSKMAQLKIEQNKRGDADLNSDTLMDIQRIIDELDNFQDLLLGIEEGRAQINTDG